MSSEQLVVGGPSGQRTTQHSPLAVAARAARARRDREVVTCEIATHRVRMGAGHVSHSSGAKPPHAHGQVDADDSRLIEGVKAHVVAAQQWTGDDAIARAEPHVELAVVAALRVSGEQRCLQPAADVEAVGPIHQHLALAVAVEVDAPRARTKPADVGLGPQKCRQGLSAAAARATTPARMICTVSPRTSRSTSSSASPLLAASVTDRSPLVTVVETLDTALAGTTPNARIASSKANGCTRVTMLSAPASPARADEVAPPGWPTL